MSDNRGLDPSSNRQDVVRDAILRFLYRVHQSARGPKGVGLGVREIQAELRQSGGYKQSEIVANLDYLVQKEWVRLDITERKFQAPGGTLQSSEKRTYKISHLGIDRLERASIYRRKVSETDVNITNINGVTVVGNGNVVNSEFTELDHVLDEMKAGIAECGEMDDSRRLETIADVNTLQSQLQKPRPNLAVIKEVWRALEVSLTATGFVELVSRAARLLAPLIGLAA